MIYLLSLLVSFNLFADFDSTLTLEHRQFNDDENSSTDDHRSALSYKLNAGHEFDSSELKASVLARIGLSNPEKNYIFIEEALYKREFSSSSLTVGWQIFNWTNLEFLAIVDNINPKNLDSVGTGIERQGLPAITFRKDFDESFIDLVWIASTQYSILPHKKSRMGVGVELAGSRSLLSDNNDDYKEEFQYILRFKKFFDDFEIDLHYARLVDTSDPMAVIEVPGNISPTQDDLTFRAYYLPKNQYAIGSQAIVGSYVFKAEALYIDYDNYKKDIFTTNGLDTATQQDHGRVSLGLERSFEFGRHSMMTFFEYTTAFGVTFEEAQRLGAFQRDVFLGTRYSLNDFRNNVFSLGFIYDVQTYEESILLFGHEVKLAQSVKLSTSIMIIETEMLEGDFAQSDFYGLKPIRESDNIQINLAYYF